MRGAINGQGQSPSKQLARGRVRRSLFAIDRRYLGRPNVSGSLIVEPTVDCELAAFPQAKAIPGVVDKKAAAAPSPAASRTAFAYALRHINLASDLSESPSPFRHVEGVKRHHAGIDSLSEVFHLPEPRTSEFGGALPSPQSLSTRRG